MENEDKDRILYRREAEARILRDPLAYMLFNPAQLRAIEAMKTPELMILLLMMGNGTGKTHVAEAIPSAIMFGTENPLFDAPIFKNWPYPKSLRIMAPSDLLGDRGPVQKAIEATWPRGRYRQFKGSGKGYYSHGVTDTGWDFDFVTFNQTALQAAGQTKGIIIVHEPLPEPHYGEAIGRLRAGGILAQEMTPLNYAAYLQDVADERVIRDPDTGKPIGKIVSVNGDIHENCSDCHEGGQLSHVAIQRTIASWPIEEREARKSGGWMQLAGRIYRKWSKENGNEIDELPAWHQKMFDEGKYNLVQVTDPHDSRPFAIAWFAVFPNDDVICIAEWPDDRYAPFHKLKFSPFSDIDDYRDMILDTEAMLGKPATQRLEDPNFGNTPKLNSRTFKELFAESCQKCAKAKTPCPHRLFYEDPPDDIEEGHTLVRRAVGNKDENVRPKFMALSSCTNMCYGMRRYGYEETKPGRPNLERPSLINKDFPDLPRYLYLAGANKYRHASAPVFKKRKFIRRANA